MQKWCADGGGCCTHIASVLWYLGYGTGINAPRYHNDVYPDYLLDAATWSEIESEEEDDEEEEQ